MRKILNLAGRVAPPVARLASALFRRGGPGTSGAAPGGYPDGWNPDEHAPLTNREFADAAIRVSRTLW
ncbi:hypothetical protein P3W85_23965 [Cupriavidus basilensis]|uniref:Uncharacterized protein n=1 Tax=Cupriavidus basilensis TaxID=68895 RepID=A0ABT6ATR6_9BURK|nr:hypothetical protein [Cupriavidus basilensis]MDF3835983.1 hypothetical protein [Cupriavidus basilensis]